MRTRRLHFHAPGSATAAFLLRMLLSAVAVAEPDANTLSIESQGGCPSAEAVRRTIRELTTVERRSAVSADCRVLVADAGTSMSVRITCGAGENGPASDVTRAYDDPARECERRARFAAVLAVVTLMPPEIAVDPEPEPEPEPKPDADEAWESERTLGLPPRSSKSPKPPRLELRSVNEEPDRLGRPIVAFQLCAVAKLAPALANGAWAASVGADFTAELGRGAWRVVLALAYEPRTELKLPLYVASGSRGRLATGVRRHARIADLDLAFDASVQLARVELRDEESFQSWEDEGFELGAGVGASARAFADASLAPFIRVGVDVFPSPLEIYRPPEGDMGHFPFLWLGLSAGVALW